MFERYTESARRSLFFARYEALQWGSRTIEVEHLLLGLLREPKALMGVLDHASGSVAEIRQNVEVVLRAVEHPDASAEIPFAPSTKRVLQFAAEEADALGHRHIGSEHLLLGILRQDESSAATVLAARGLSIKSARDAVAALPSGASHLGMYTTDGLYATVTVGEETGRVLEAIVGIAHLVERLSRQIPDTPENHALIVEILRGLRDLEARLRR